jgi:hypothetical protein
MLFTIVIISTDDGLVRGSTLDSDVVIGKVVEVLTKNDYGANILRKGSVVQILSTFYV